MKYLPILASVSFALHFGTSIALAQAPTPLLEYKFNETGTTVTDSGSSLTDAVMHNSANTLTDLHTADQGGVSGLAGDRAFDNTASVSTGGNGGSVEQLADNDAFDLFTSFTIQTWVKDTSLVTNGRLVENAGGSNNPYRVSTAGTGAMSLTVDGSTATSANNLREVGNWVFFALSWDTTDGTVNFYKGTTTTAVSLFSTGTIAGKGQTNNDGTIFAIGNNDGQSRSWDATLDNFRLWGAATGSGGVVSMADLETIRQADLIPEPQTWVTLLGGVGTLLGFQRRRRILS
jgi:hypothetical protein